MSYDPEQFVYYSFRSFKSNREEEQVNSAAYRSRYFMISYYIETLFRLNGEIL
jgi:hypothetical protein